MAILSNTYQTFDAKGIREQLSDVISRIDPEECPIQSNSSSESVQGTLYEWQTDKLRAAALNAAPQGDQATNVARSPTVRVGNYTQISRDSFGLTGTLEAVQKAGRRTEKAYQLAKVGVEIRRDIEYTLAQANQGGYAGATNDAPKTATLHAWLKTVVDKASDGANPAWTSGVPSTGRTDGTTRQFTMTIVNSVMAKAVTAGAKPRLLMVDPAMKQHVSTFDGIATSTYFQSAVKATAIIGAVDVIVTDFGTLAVVTNLFQRHRDAWFLDPSMYKLAVLRPFERIPLAKRGDSDEILVLKEWGLKVNNEAGLGAAFDLKTTP